MSGTLNLPALIAGTGSFSGSTSEPVLHVTQTSSGPALEVHGSSAAGVNAFVSESSSDGGSGVLGSASAPTGLGVVGLHTAASGSSYGVRALTYRTEGTGVQGMAYATGGSTTGVRGAANSTGGIGVAGRAWADSGNTVGVYGGAVSPDGTAGKFDNLAGGVILKGLVSGDLKFSVRGNGNVWASGSVTATSFSGDGSGLSGVGDITEVNAGEGLGGGGGGGAVTLSLDTTYTDGRYALLVHGHDVSQVAGAPGWRQQLLRQPEHQRQSLAHRLHQ